MSSQQGVVPGRLGRNSPSKKGFDLLHHHTVQSVKENNKMKSWLKYLLIGVAAVIAGMTIFNTVNAAIEDKKEDDEPQTASVYVCENL